MNKKQKQHKTKIPGHYAGASVIDKDIAYALRVFKRKVKESQVLDVVKENQTYIKPSEKRRAEKSRAKYIQYIRDLNRD